MGAWVISICGIAVLAVLCDVILPDGNTRKYIKTVVGIVITLVIVQPIISLFTSSESGNWIQSGGKVEIQQSYLNHISQRQETVAIDNVKRILNDSNIQVDNISVVDEKIVELRLDAEQTSEKEKTVNQVLNRYFPNYKIIIIWK